MAPLILALAFLAYLPALAFAAFGVSASGNSITVDTGGGLVFVVESTSGDITSLLYNNVQYQDSSKRSHLSSGLGSASVSYTTISGTYIKVTVSTSTLTHYYVAKSGSSAIYMATYITAEPSIGELRWIARLKKSAAPTGISQAEIVGGTAIEGSDVFTVNGQTRSKFFSSVRFISDQVHGVTGSGVGIYMVMPGTAYESSSGGPFFRDINNQGGDQQELYWYMNSGHQQTESYRTGLFGPYAMVFTSGSAPSASLDVSFFSSLSITGYVAASGRGTIRGTASGVPSGFTAVVGFANNAAQYWATVNGGSYTSPLMKPGTYTATLYKGELAVGTGSVSVSAGGTSTLNIGASVTAPSSIIWQIGDEDGTPAGFRNAANIEKMHPSDSRMSSWSPGTYIVGSSSISAFPMAIFKAVNNGQKIQFTLTSSQVGAATFRIRTTEAFAGGRPTVTINNWTSSSPGAPPNIDSRGITRGTWRGVNMLYEWSVPSGTLVSGTNTATITVISGSSGDAYLSPNIVVDSVMLYK